MSYSLSKKAERELKDIGNYTLAAWGRNQLRRYQEKLEKGIEGAINGGRYSKDKGSIFPGLRQTHIEHHYVFYRMLDKQTAFIERIVYERSNYQQEITRWFSKEIES